MTKVIQIWFQDRLITMLRLRSAQVFDLRSLRYLRYSTFSVRYSLFVINLLVIQDAYTTLSTSSRITIYEASDIFAIRHSAFDVHYLLLSYWLFRMLSLRSGKISVLRFKTLQESYGD
ncbi:hypothetical protein [Algoriphagus sp.]|uniref:hypothetical protein n=1 Tax=Algoriphagus sp. TaxID=1872435 RepID=UPI00391C6B53